MSPEVWREFFKEPYRKLYDYLHSQGVIVMHHADSYLEPIVEIRDMQSPQLRQPETLFQQETA